MNRVAAWVAQTAVGATVLIAARASPLPEIAANAGLDPDIAAPRLVAMDLSHGLEGMAGGAVIQRARSASASNALTVLLIAANDSRIHDTNGSVPVPARARHR